MSDNPKPTPGLGPLALAVAAGVVPGFAAEFQRRLDIEEAAIRLAAVAGPELLERYADEVERRWEFAVETARGTAQWKRPDKAALIRSMTSEIAAGIL